MSCIEGCPPLMQLHQQSKEQLTVGAVIMASLQACLDGHQPSHWLPHCCHRQNVVSAASNSSAKCICHLCRRSMFAIFMQKYAHTYACVSYLHKKEEINLLELNWFCLFVLSTLLLF